MNAQNGATSLHWACQEKHTQTVKFLISSGANIEALDKVFILLANGAFFSRVFTPVGIHAFSSDHFQWKFQNHEYSY